MMSQLDHIENRIRWRAKKNAVRTSNTDFWESAPESLKERAGAALEKPVFYSMADESTATIVGADGILLVDGDNTKMIPHIDLGGVFCQDVGIAAPQDKASSLRIAIRQRGTVKAFMEDGPASYCVWKVLRMLLDMREAWFLPEPVEEPPAEESPEACAKGEGEGDASAKSNAGEGVQKDVGDATGADSGLAVADEAEGVAEGAAEAVTEAKPEAPKAEEKRADATAGTDAV